MPVALFQVNVPDVTQRQRDHSRRNLSFDVPCCHIVINNTKYKVF